MKVSELVGREKITEEERMYLLSTFITKAYRYTKDKTSYLFCYFEDGSITRTDDEADEEISADEIDMEKLRQNGFMVEDVSDEYADN